MKPETVTIRFFGCSLDYEIIRSELRQSGVNFIPTEWKSSDQITTFPVGNLLSEEEKPIFNVEFIKERYIPGYYIRGTVPNDLIVRLEDKIPNLFDGQEKKDSGLSLVINEAEVMKLFVNVTKEFYRQSQTSSTNPTGA